jgi:hypothetical protein
MSISLYPRLVDVPLECPPYVPMDAVKRAQRYTRICARTGVDAAEVVRAADVAQLLSEAYVLWNPFMLWFQRTYRAKFNSYEMTQMGRVIHAKRTVFIERRDVNQDNRSPVKIWTRQEAWDIYRTFLRELDQSDTL